MPPDAPSRSISLGISLLEKTPQEALYQGIPPEDLYRIFEPFYTTKGAIGTGRQKGVGLGLAISHGLVSELGGEIRAENIPDGGTRFTVLLPLS